MAAIDKLNRARKNLNNEYYTMYDDVEFLFEHTLINQYLKDKIIYLPCDTEESNIYKYLIDNKEKIHYKEIIHTSDDYYGHLDLYEKADVVLTNPPFTGIIKWIKFLLGLNKKYIIWFPKMGLYPNVIKEHKFICENTRYSARNDKDNNPLSPMYYIIDNQLYKTNKLNNFITPNGEKNVDVYLISNEIEYFHNFIYIGNGDKKRKVLSECKNLYYNNENILLVREWKYIPKDFKGLVYIPLSSYINYSYKCELIEVYKAVKCQDGKLRPRALVKINK